MLSISFLFILMISLYTSWMITSLMIFIMFSLGFFMNHSMGIGFSSLFCELMDSFVVWPITYMVISYMMPGFEPLLCFSFEGYPLDMLNMSGQQWFWSYMNNNINSFEETLLQRSYSDGLFLLYSMNPCFFSLYHPILIMGDSLDVIHSWGVPSLGIKFDLIPGHISLETMLPLVSGYFMGGCFEMCGAYHSFMSMNLIII